MKRKTETSELIFRIIAYTILVIFALLCIYPLLYALVSMFSNADAITRGEIIIWPVGFQTEAFMHVINEPRFWISYANTLFVTFIGTMWCLLYSILGAYALSKKRLVGRHGFNFFLVFTMWFSAGIIPQFMNYNATGRIMAQVFAGTSDMTAIDLKWLIVLAMGMNATNIILLRNAFEGVPSEIEEAARIDGATELQILTKVYIPMSKATIATVALFFGISRWNGYFWAYKVTLSQEYSWPVQVFIRDHIEKNTNLTGKYTPESAEMGQGIGAAIAYALVIFAMIPILVIYPFIQKYFAKGVNMGGVKE